MVNVLKIIVYTLVRACGLGLFWLMQVNAAPTADKALRLDDIGLLLTRSHHVEARFVEQQYSAMLSTPLRSEGVIGFTPPARLEKHVTTPRDELFIADGDKVFVVNKTAGTSRNISIDDHPALRAFVEAFRSMLAGRMDTLQRYFQLSVDGTRNGWQVTARPRDEQMRTLVETIRFAGVGDQIKQVDIQEASGDRSEMRIVTTVP